MVSGANVFIKELGIGAVSNHQGIFKLSDISKEQFVLSVSCIGYEKYNQNITINDLDEKEVVIILTQAEYSIDSVFVTATRYKKSINDIPGSLSFLNKKQITEIPVNNTDDALRSIANVYVNRSWGIYSKNASVTMRGLEGSARTLILLNGVPLNKSAGGSINWHMINPDHIQKIEVIKGPASALYGGNAMAGVINIITAKPEKGLNGSVVAQYGTYNSMGTSIDVSHNGINNGKGYYMSLNSYYRQGDGYIYEAYELRDSTDIPLTLKEFTSSWLLGYQWNNKKKLELNYSFYKDKRGGGVHVYEDEGSYYSIRNDYLNLKYQTSIKDIEVEILGFYQYEDYFQKSESLNSYDEYKLSESSAQKNDNGLWMNFSKMAGRKNKLSWGMDFKYGDVKSLTTYKTSTDILNYSGKLNFYALFVQDELDLIDRKLKVITGLRLDLARFYSGQLIVTNPSKTTGFIESFTDNFKVNNWYSLNPKIALKYFVNNRLSFYTSASRGMMPPKLDDLCKSGKIRKGFKLANPMLQPEHILTTEIGSTIKLNNFQIQPTVYYSLGNDFQYFVGTGDYVDTGGDNLKPVYKRQNIAAVEIKGAELSLNYNFSDYQKLKMSYSYNHSKIKDFEVPDSNSNDLTSNYLMEVSPHLLYVGISSNWKIFSTYVSYNYIDKQWADDENIILVEDYSLVNLKFYKTFRNKLTTSLEIQNLFDEEYVDRKMQLSPGRFVVFEVKYKL